ncbi:MAG: MurT ligase domain-containing protein, partial [Steroidobacteraceae bacterium]
MIAMADHPTVVEVQKKPRNHTLSWRSGAALRLGAVAARLSRLAGFGGQMIGGRVSLVLAPGCLRELAAARHIVLVSGTNGKTTTTAMLTAALGTAGPVTSNSSGANMLDGLTTVLATTSESTVVGEIDELYLPEALSQTHPEALLLLNLSRDQLDRAGEIHSTALRLQDSASAHPEVVVVANCDDPYVVFVALAFATVVWVSAGNPWRGDSATCPQCRHALRSAGGAHGHWECTGCGLSRPVPGWALTERPVVSDEGTAPHGPLITPSGRAVTLQLGVPGEFNRCNAAMAVACAHAMGVEESLAATAVGSVTDAAGRFRKFTIDARSAVLILAKNPAGWASTLELVRSRQAPVIIAINAEEADGKDTSWLYDVDFESLAGLHVVASGRR